MGRDSGFKRAWGALMMFFLCFFSYQPLANDISDMVANATTTNPVWVFMDSFFSLFWTILIIFWIMLALYFIIGDM